MLNCVLNVCLCFLAEEFLRTYQSGGQIEAQSVAMEHVNASLVSARDCVRESINRQEALLADIQSTHEAVFGKQKKTSSGVAAAAGTSLMSTLLMAAESYGNLLSDVGQGITFYADLTRILVKFQNKVSPSRIHSFGSFFVFLVHGYLNLCTFLPFLVLVAVFA